MYVYAGAHTSFPHTFSSIGVKCATSLNPEKSVAWIYACRIYAVASNLLTPWGR